MCKVASLLSRGAHPVSVLIVAAVLGERCFRPLSQEDLGADVAVTGGPSAEHGAQGHLTERGGAARHGEGRLVPEVRAVKSVMTVIHLVDNCDLMTSLSCPQPVILCYFNTDI